MTYSVGKLPNSVLAKLLSRHPQHDDPRVLVGPRIGEDAAVLDFGEACLVVSTDPITFATDRLGWYVVHINANDVAVRGARPRWFSAVLLLPEGRTDDVLVESIFSEIYDACESLGCTLIGGHTEITTEITRPIVIGQMMGEVSRDKLVTTSGAKEGDALLLTRGIALEGTALLARERAAQLREFAIPEEVITRAQNLLFDPGISIVRDALAANTAVAVHAMHDPTEGGLATALAELAEASATGIQIAQEQIPILPECEIICAALGLDPMGTLASGALLIAVAPTDAEKLIQVLAKQDTPCVQIGILVSPEQGRAIRKREGIEPLPVFQRDEVAKVL